MGILSRFLNKPPKSAPTEPSPAPEPAQAVEPQPIPQPEPEPQTSPEPAQATAIAIPEPSPPTVLAPVPRSSSQSVVKKPQSSPRQGTATRTPLSKVLDILTLYDDGTKPSQIAEQIHADIRTVGAVIRQYRDRPASAKQLLAQSAVMAAHAWQQAVPIAAARGNHGPAKELLLHVGAIEPAYGPGAARPTNVAVQVIIGTPDSPIPDDPLTKAKPVK